MFNWKIGIIILILFLFGGLLLIKEFSNFGKLTAGPERCCGNGKLDYNEVCDTSIPDAATLAASTYAINDLGDWMGGPPDGIDDGDFSQDGVVDDVDYNMMINACGTDCKFICPPTDANFVHIDEGCYGFADPCQKGKWICDTDSTSPDYQTVICYNVFNDPASPDFIGIDLFDYCCVDAGSALPGMVGTFSIVRGTNAAGFDCDDVCRDAGGKICIGVGLMNVATHHCKSIKHNLNPTTSCAGHTTYNCQNDVNIMANDCRATFKIRMPTDCLECHDTDMDGVDEAYFFGVWETACYCK